ncbi:MAG TPA: nuclear transport factor 2 family protein [Gemmatimonadales bacterium]|nr:nuclear transport factor 2 family protein [Gemmatimonadales bacterium]
MTPATAGIGTEILALERRYWEAMQARDVRTAVSLTDFPCLIAGASGVRAVDQPSYEKMMTGASWRIHQFEIEDGAEVRQLTDDVAVIVYRIREEMTVDGNPVTLRAADSSVWVRRDAGWRCAAHTEAVAGDGFGRSQSST